MTKTFFHRQTGNACVFDDSEVLANWPDFQEFPFPEITTSGSVLGIRKKALEVSDWMAVQDRTMTQEQRDYRQALRDIPQQTAFQDGRYDDVVWPTKPADTSSL
jgi:hypothetical protein|tara:strand:- start:1189 stop:1500 length:312 start_codon:yes stop_codon:yes gene_type:complete